MDWQLIETAIKDGAVKIGTDHGVVFTMVWRVPGWFTFEPTEALDVPEKETGAWVVQGYGLVAYAGDGSLQIVTPTHWAPIDTNL